ncbi:MAG: HTH domain-containing protein [Gammaproteobacteria bacterium]|nr:HTH domain-containing protein [Gammaproteobacteria bacterium]
MTNTIESLKTYVNEVLGKITRVHKWIDASSLPFFLQESYEFYSVDILDRTCLLMISRSPVGDSPAVVKKHLNGVVKHYIGDVIYVVEAISSFNRKRLIEQNISFIVPGNQLYLPLMGLDLREYFKSVKETKQKALSAVSQVLLLRYILGHYKTPLSAKELAEWLGYSSMTLTRAIKDLEEKGLARSTIKGREKHLIFPLDAKELWLIAKPYLQNPVKKTLWITKPDRDFPALISGESALSDMTMIAEPKKQIQAIFLNEWAGLKKLMKLNECDKWASNSIQLELWRYNPCLLTEKDVIDPLSLWLSLTLASEKLNNERIDMALEELMDKFWSKEL